MLNITICGVNFKNPVIAASGAFGYGLEYEKYIDLNKIGGISVKGLSLNKHEGNPMPRIVETASGMLNAIGLENIGVHEFVEEKLPLLKKYDTKIIANFWGKNRDEYVEVAEILDNSDIDMLEMNISCPNIKEGGISFGTDKKMTYSVINSVKKRIKNKPLAVKLSPNVTDIKEFAKTSKDAGADAISAINTLLGMAIDINTLRPILSNVTGGLSGPAIKPVALRMVYEISNVVEIPIMGIGGIMSYVDAIEFLLAGASAVQIGTANFINPETSLKIIDQLSKYLKDNNYKSISDITGALKI